MQTTGHVRAHRKLQELSGGRRMTNPTHTSHAAWMPYGCTDNLLRHPTLAPLARNAQPRPTKCGSKPLPKEKRGRTEECRSTAAACARRCLCVCCLHVSELGTRGGLRVMPASRLSGFRVNPLAKPPGIERANPRIQPAGLMPQGRMTY